MHYLLTFACFKARVKLSLFKGQIGVTCSRTVTFALSNLMVEPGYAKCQSFCFHFILASSSELCYTICPFPPYECFSDGLAYDLFLKTEISW